MPSSETFSGVSNCYVFKSRLQEYTQKVGLSTPVYQTIKEGPSHEPSFQSTVIVNDIRYDSLPGFANRKAAEQSAAEVALMELVKAGQVDQSISVPVHETGLCKNLLQEYAQKMNYAIPFYRCEKQETEGRSSLFTCSVEVGGIKYVGAAAKIKKDAEIKAARTALLSIQSAASKSSDTPLGNSQLTVIPCKKRGPERTDDVKETASVPKAKKSRNKKKMWKKKHSGNRVNLGHPGTPVTDQPGSEPGQIDALGVQGEGCGLLAPVAGRDIQAEWICANQIGIEACTQDCAVIPTDGVAILQGTADLNGNYIISSRENILESLAS